MLTTLTLSLQPGLAGPLGRAALCSAPLLLKRVAASTTAALHDAAVVSQQHHKPPNKPRRDAFSLAPFLAKPGQARQASAEAMEWNDRWAACKPQAGRLGGCSGPPPGRPRPSRRSNRLALQGAGSAVQTPRASLPAAPCPSAMRAPCPPAAPHNIAFDTSRTPAPPLSPAGCATSISACPAARATPATWRLARPASPSPRRTPASATAITVRAAGARAWHSMAAQACMCLGGGRHGAGICAVALLLAACHRSPAARAPTRALAAVQSSTWASPPTWRSPTSRAAISTDSPATRR